MVADLVLQLSMVRDLKGKGVRGAFSKNCPGHDVSPAEGE